MFQKDYIPSWLTLFLATGIFIEYHFSFDITDILFTAGILFAILTFMNFYKRKRLLPPRNYFLFSMLLFILIGMTAVQTETKDHHEFKNLEQEKKIVFRIDEILKENIYSRNYKAIILQVNGERIKETILVSLSKDSLNVINPEVDDIFYTSAVLRTIDPPLNPYQFSYKAYLRTKQIFYRLKLKPEELLKIKSEKRTLKGFSYQVRKKINTALKEHNFSEDQLSVINALLLGQRQNIGKELFEDYKDAGAVHILAISGLHVGVLLFLLNFVLKPLEYFKNGKNIKLILIIILLWSFAFLAGFSASVVRAVSMFSLIAIGLYSKRKLAVINALILSMFFLLLFHPLYLFEAGFQLSYLAVFFIITLQPRMAKLWQPGSKIIYYFWQLLSVSLSAQIGVLPLSLYYFHQFPGLFFVSGLVIIPFLGLILGLGILVILFSVLNVLPDFLAERYGLLIEVMNRFITLISEQEAFIFKEISFSLPLMLLFYIVFFFALKAIVQINFKNLIYFLSGIILIQIFLIYERNAVQETNEFVVFGKYKNTLIGIRKGRILKIYTNEEQEKAEKNKIIKDYRTGKGNIDSLSSKALQNFYTVNGLRIMLIDSSSLYLHDYQPDIVILSGNPKINFERLIKDIHPESVITDQNNYHYLVDQWKATAKEYGIRFYSVSEKGAFRYRY